MVGVNMKQEAKVATTRKRRRWIWIIVVGLVILWLMVGLRFITFAQPDTPRPVDAVYLLGPVYPERLDAGLQLIELGYSSDLVATVSGNDELQKSCRQEQPYDLHCVLPDPVTTGGEALAFSELAEQRQWESVMIVTHRSHMARAELLFTRCFSGSVSMIVDERPVTFESRIHQLIYENAAFVKHTFIRTC